MGFLKRANTPKNSSTKWVFHTRRNVAWVLVMLYLALGVFFAAVNALFNPGA